MKRKISTLFVTLAVALMCSTALAQSVGEWETTPPTGQQGNGGDTGGLRIKCGQGVEGCAQQGEHSHSSGGATGSGNTGGSGSGNDIDQIGGGNPPQTGGNDPTRTDELPRIDPPAGGGTDNPNNEDPEAAREREEAERIAGEARRAREQANDQQLDGWQRANAQQIVDQRLARMRHEMNRRVRAIERTSGNDKAARAEIAKLRAWYSALTKAGFDEEAAKWLKDNREALDELIQLNSEGELTWLSDNVETIKVIKGDYDEFASDGTTLVSLKNRVSNLENKSGNGIAVPVIGGATALAIVLALVALLRGGGNKTPKAAKPQIASVTPDNGPVAGGTIISLKGSNLTSTMLFEVGGNPARVATFVGPDQVNIETPPATKAGVVDIVFGEPGSRPYVLKNAFEYN